MLDSNDMQAIRQLLEESEKRILTETTANMNVLIESKIQPKLNALAEGHKLILDKLVPRSRVDELDEEVKFLKAIVRQLSEELQQLKKAI